MNTWHHPRFTYFVHELIGYVQHTNSSRWMMTCMSSSTSTLMEVGYLVHNLRTQFMSRLVINGLSAWMFCFYNYILFAIFPSWVMYHVWIVLMEARILVLLVHIESLHRQEIGMWVLIVATCILYIIRTVSSTQHEAKKKKQITSRNKVDINQIYNPRSDKRVHVQLVPHPSGECF